jgi:RNA polymerase sigma-70 factor (ECF subfamily)
LEDIIRECLDGKEGAWKMLVDLFSKRIFNLAYQFAGNAQEAEDLTQDIFLKLHRNLDRYDFDRNFAAWLLTLAKNHLIDEYRRTKWEKRNRDDFDDQLRVTASADDGPETGLAAEETKKVLWEGLNRLSPETRMAVILKEIQGRKYEEVAEILNVPVGTVKSRINRGRVQLAGLIRSAKERSHEL